MHASAYYHNFLRDSFTIRTTTFRWYIYCITSSEGLYHTGTQVYHPHVSHISQQGAQIFLNNPRTLLLHKFSVSQGFLLAPFITAQLLTQIATMASNNLKKITTNASQKEIKQLPNASSLY